MTTFVMTREWIDELDAARQILHSHLPISSAFSDELPLREATVVFVSIGDMIRGCVVPTNAVEDTDSSDPEPLLVDPTVDYSSKGSGFKQPTPTPTDPVDDSDPADGDNEAGEGDVNVPDDVNPYKDPDDQGSGTYDGVVPDYNPFGGY